MSECAEARGAARSTEVGSRKRKSCADEEGSDQENKTEGAVSSCKKVKADAPPVTVLDGGMGRELDVKYPDPDFKSIWSAAHLLNQPESVYKCHLSFIEAGAEIITTSNYSCVPSFLNKLGITDKMYDLIRTAGEEADKAKKCNPSVRVAGSIPPFGFSYMGLQIPEGSEVVSRYAKIAQVLYPFVDLFLCETMSSVDEAVAALSGLQAARRDGMLGDKEIPVWLSFTLLDRDAPGELFSRETLDAALHTVLDKFPGLVEGLFLNCCAPHAITAALPTLIRVAKEYDVSTFGAYANRFASISETAVEIEDKFLQDAHARRIIDIPEEMYLGEVKSWIALGCNVVGGCCGMGPSYIQRISRFVEKSPEGAVAALATE